MKKITSLLLLISCYTGFSQKATPTALTRYIHLTGVIDKYPVTFHLYRVDNSITGHYYYDNTCQPIDINGQLDKTGSLKLIHTSESGDTSEIFKGPFKDSVYSGTWTYKGKPLNFRVTKQQGTLQFDYITVSGSKKLPVKPEYGPDELSYDAATIWPTADSKGVMADSIRRFIRSRFGEGNSTDEIGKIMLRRKNELINAKKNSEDEIEVYSESDEVQVEYMDARLLSINYSVYGYTGGAHGNYASYLTNFDLSNGQQIPLHEVLDTTAAKLVMSNILEKKFRTQYASMISPEDKLENMLLVDKIPMNDNFLLTPKGITFRYVPYEIGAYAMGEINLYIPFKEIDSLLKPGFRKFSK